MRQIPMVGLRWWIGCGLLLLTVWSPATGPAAEPGDRRRAEMERFERLDRRQPSPEGAVLFVGSSSIRLWNLEQSFGPLPTVNRGFGGSQFSDIVRHADRLIAPHRPRAVVLYSGDNDLAAGKSPRQVVEDLAEVVAAIRRTAPDAPIVVLGIKPSTRRWNLAEAMRDTNERMARFAAENPGVAVIDSFPPMLDAAGRPRAELLAADGLHLSEAGYAVWTPLVRQALMLPEE